MNKNIFIENISLTASYIHLLFETTHVLMRRIWNQIPIMLQLNPRFGQHGGTPIYNPNKRCIRDNNLNEEKYEERPTSHKSKTHDRSMKDVEIGEKKPNDQNSPIDVALEEELLERERGKKKSDSEFRGCYDTLSAWISSIWCIPFKSIF